MNVEVRHALAHNIVDRHKGSLRMECLRHNGGNPLCVPEQWGDQLGREIGECLVVRAGDQEHMAREQRSCIEEADGDLIFEYDVTGEGSLGDIAENAAHDFLFRWS